MKLSTLRKLYEFSNTLDKKKKHSYRFLVIGAFICYLMPVLVFGQDGVAPVPMETEIGYLELAIKSIVSNGPFAILAGYLIFNLIKLNSQLLNMLQDKLDSLENTIGNKLDALKDEVKSQH